jgi:hypothetical protein
MLIARFVSENVKKDAKKARACNIARWFVSNYAKLEGTFVSARDIREQIPANFKKPGLTARGDQRAHSEALTLLGLSSVKQGRDRMVDVSLINLKRSTSFLLGSRSVGAIYIKSLTSATQDLNLVDELAKVCGNKTVNFKKLDTHTRAFVENLATNYPARIKQGRLLSDRQRSWALDLIDANRCS